MMGNLAVVRLVLLFIAASLLGACAMKGGEPALMYRLTITPEGAATPSLDRPRESLDIEVLPLRSNRPQGGSLGILVVQAAAVVRVEEFSAGRWEEPPETMIERAVTTELGRFASTVQKENNPGDMAPRLQLQWSLDQFEVVEPDDGGTPYAAVAMTLRLQESPGRVQVEVGAILEREYVPTNAPLDTIVLAFNRATSRAVSRIARFAIDSTRS